MSDELASATAVAGTDTLYTVQIGDSLSKIALRFYGDASRYPEIAARNNIAPNTVLYIGQRIIIPVNTVKDTTMPESPGGSVPVVYGNDIIETVTTTAVRIKFWQDWRFWAVVGTGAVVIWYVSRKPRRD